MIDESFIWEIDLELVVYIVMARYMHWFHIDKAGRSTPIGARSIRLSMEKEFYADLQVWDLYY